LRDRPTSWMDAYIRPSSRRKRREDNDYSFKKFPDKLDRELIQKHGYKYLTWKVEVDFELSSEPRKLETWDFVDSQFDNFTKNKHVLVGHYEIVTEKNKGMVSGCTHFDYIHFPESKVKVELTGGKSQTIKIPEQTVFFDNLPAGDWRMDQLNPYAIIIRLDLEKKRFSYDSEDLADFEGVSDLERYE